MKNRGSIELFFNALIKKVQHIINGLFRLLMPVNADHITHLFYLMDIDRQCFNQAFEPGLEIRRKIIADLTLPDPSSFQLSLQAPVNAGQLAPVALSFSVFTIGCEL